MLLTVGNVVCCLVSVTEMAKFIDQEPDIPFYEVHEVIVPHLGHIPIVKGDFNRLPKKAQKFIAFYVSMNLTTLWCSLVYKCDYKFVDCKAGLYVFRMYVPVHSRPTCQSIHKNVSNVNEIRHASRGQWVMHNCMPYDPIQGQGHKMLSLKLFSVFKVCLPVMEKLIRINSNAESIPIDSHCRIVMKNFDSVPQLQRLSCVHHCCNITSWLTFAAMSLLTSAKAISSSVVMRTGRLWFRWTGPGASDQSPEPLVWTVEGDSDRAVNRIELNRIDSFVALTRIESFSFLPNRPSLLSTLQVTVGAGKWQLIVNWAHDIRPYLW